MAKRMIYGGLLFELVALKCELYESVPILIAFQWQAPATGATKGDHRKSPADPNAFGWSPHVVLNYH
jgi:hypothetical protein